MVERTEPVTEVNIMANRPIRPIRPIRLEEIPKFASVGWGWYNILPQ